MEGVSFCYYLTTVYGLKKWDIFFSSIWVLAIPWIKFVMRVLEKISLNKILCPPVVLDLGERALPLALHSSSSSLTHTKVGLAELSRTQDFYWREEKLNFLLFKLQCSQNSELWSMNSIKLNKRDAGRGRIKESTSDIVLTWRMEPILSMYPTFSNK